MVLLGLRERDCSAKVQEPVMLMSAKMRVQGTHLLAVVLHWQATKHHRVGPWIRHHVDPRAFVRLGL